MELKSFFLNKAAREQFFQGKLVRELNKAADPCFKAQTFEKKSTNFVTYYERYENYILTLVIN